MTAARQLSLWKGKRQRGTKAPPAKEFAIHCMVADTLWRWSAPDWYWTHIGHGERRDAVAGARLKRLGLKPGLPDLLLIGPDGRHYYLELKRGKASLQPEQAAFLAMLKARGVPYAVARSYDEAIEQLALWGAVRARLTA